MKKALNFKFVKNQTIFLLEYEFFISVRKIKVLKIIHNHHYKYVDPWGEYEDEWHCGDAIKVLENDRERIIAIENLENAFVFTSAKKAFNQIKNQTSDIEYFNLNSDSSFNGGWKI